MPMTTSLSRQSSPEENLRHPANRPESESGHLETHALLGEDRPELLPKSPPFSVRILVLLCVCSLSVGVHYAGYILGPLKSRIQRELGTTHTEFGLLFSAYSLNSTWTPLFAGLLVTRLGTTTASILATGVIFLGQLVLLVGELWGNVRLMALGLFIFGFGASPLAVVQETIVVRFFKKHGLGVSMALGLVAGKGSSFVAARTSYPLTERFGSSGPFYVSTILTGFSVAVNLVYIAISKRLVDGAGAELETPDFVHEAEQVAPTNVVKAQALKRTAEKHKVYLKEIGSFGDDFWAYIALNVLCGMIWSPFSHLATNIIESRYQLSEEDAATKASYLLAGSIILYPICGIIVDSSKRRPIVIYLLMLSSALTASAYTWLVITPAWTRTPVPAIFSFAIGYGFSPLLLAVIVPQIVVPKYVSTALGAHKSLEQTGSILFQTLAGLALDVKSKEKSNAIAIQRLLGIFLLLNGLQMLSILLLALLRWRRDRALKRNHGAVSRVSIGRQNISPPSAETPFSSVDLSYSSVNIPTGSGSQTDIISASETRRGRLFRLFAFLLVASAWFVYLGTAYYRLGRKESTLPKGGRSRA